MKIFPNKKEKTNKIKNLSSKGSKNSAVFLKISDCMNIKKRQFDELNVKDFILY